MVAVVSFSSLYGRNGFVINLRIQIPPFQLFRCSMNIHIRKDWSVPHRIIGFQSTARESAFLFRQLSENILYKIQIFLCMQAVLLCRVWCNNITSFPSTLDAVGMHIPDSYESCLLQSKIRRNIFTIVL